MLRAWLASAAALLALLACMPHAAIAGNVKPGRALLEDKFDLCIRQLKACSASLTPCLNERGSAALKATAVCIAPVAAYLAETSTSLGVSAETLTQCANTLQQCKSSLDECKASSG